MAGNEPPTLEQQMDGWWEVETDLENGRIQSAALTDANQYVAGNTLALMKRAVGPDLSLSNYPGKARAKVRVDGDRSTLEFTPAGLWALVSEGAAPHPIARPAKAVTRLASGRYMTGPMAGRTRHPGMRRLGRPLKDTVKDMDSEFLEAYGDQIDQRVL